MASLGARPADRGDDLKAARGGDSAALGRLVAPHRGAWFRRHDEYAEDTA
jgi:hypothetical protein